MSDYHTFIDTVKIEKANAIARYQRFNSLAKLLQSLQFVLLVAILSWSSTRFPDAVRTFKISGKYVAEYSTYVLNPHVVFLIGNAIVLSLYILSRHIDVGDSSDFFDDYEKTEDRLSVATIDAVEAPVEMIGEEEKQIVCHENLNVINEKESQIVEKVPDIQIKKLERTKSDKFQQAKPKKEFRRSETDFRQRMSNNLSTFETVDTLSNEDFRLTIEAFIEKQQNFIRQQRMAELIVYENED